MQKHPTAPQGDSPFFSLLANADEVQIREIQTSQPDRIYSNLEKTLREFEHQKAENGLRTFFVHIKTPSPLTKPVDKNASGYSREELKKAADVLLQNKDYLLARNLFSFLLQGELRDAVALRGLGICLFRLGEITSSRKCFRALTELFQSEEAHYWLALGYETAGQDELAIQHFEKVTQPENLTSECRFEFHKNFGNCLTRLGKLDQAEAKYLKALELNPSSDILHVNLGTLFMQRKQWQQARERFQRAVTLNPFSSRAYCGLGLSELAQCNPVAAEAFFHQALDQDPQNLVALHQLLELAQNQDQTAALKKRLQAFLEKGPHPDIHFAMAALLFKEGSWKACEFHVDRVLERQPKHVGAMKLKSDLNSLVGTV